MLVREILNEAERRGADKVFLNAKIPDFYQKLGFEILQREKAPAISDCSTCSRYLHGCKPEIMVKRSLELLHIYKYNSTVLGDALIHVC